MVTQIYLRMYQVNSQICIFRSITVDNFIFNLKRPIFLRRCPTHSELPSILSAIYLPYTRFKLHILWNTVSTIRNRYLTYGHQPERILYIYSLWHQHFESNNKLRVNRIFAWIFLVKTFVCTSYSTLKAETTSLHANIHLNTLYALY